MPSYPRIACYLNAVVSAASAPQATGSRAKELGVIDGLGEDWHNQIKPIEPGAKVLLWSRATDPLFDFFSIYLLGKGVLDVAYSVDLPTSTSNLSPTGTARRMIHRTLSCSGVFMLGSPFVPLSTSVETTGVTGLLPTIAGHYNTAGRLYGIVRSVMVRNAGTDDATYRFNASSGFGG